MHNEECDGMRKKETLKDLIKKIKKGYRHHVLGSKIEFEFDKDDLYFNQDGTRKKLWWKL